MGCSGCGKRRRAFQSRVAAARKNEPQKPTEKKPVTRADKIEARRKRIEARNERIRMRNELAKRMKKDV
jgi:hypothetical protein